jgi:hypothetical protein
MPWFIPINGRMRQTASIYYARAKRRAVKAEAAPSGKLTGSGSFGEARQYGYGTDCCYKGITQKATFEKRDEGDIPGIGCPSCACMNINTCGGKHSTSEGCLETV